MGQTYGWCILAKFLMSVIYAVRISIDRKCEWKWDRFQGDCIAHNTSALMDSYWINCRWCEASIARITCAVHKRIVWYLWRCHSQCLSAFVLLFIGYIPIVFIRMEIARTLAPIHTLGDIIKIAMVIVLAHSARRHVARQQFIDSSWNAHINTVGSILRACKVSRLVNK